MVCFGYEAKGDGTPDICYYNVSPDGKFTEVVWLVAPVVAMIHDFAVTDNWVRIFACRSQRLDTDQFV
jgi:carotenoid cleavage dioxygenase